MTVCSEDCGEPDKALKRIFGFCELLQEHYCDEVIIVSLLKMACGIAVANEYSSDEVRDLIIKLMKEESNIDEITRH